ncbi:hypothetical protein MMPV_003076 [Pyropia vietnamensis]
MLLLSSTAGVYSHPPDHPDARLLPLLAVSINSDEGSVSTEGGAVATTDVAAHDVTGGMSAKVAAAAAAVRARRGGLRVLFSSIPAVGGGRGGWAAGVGALLEGVEKDGQWGGGGHDPGGRDSGGVQGTWMVFAGEGGADAPSA